MAFWNAPLEDPKQEIHACESALAMFESLTDLNSERQREAEEGGYEYLPLNIGIGMYDRGLGATFGTTIQDGPDQAEAQAAHFRRVAEKYLN